MQRRYAHGLAMSSILYFAYGSNMSSARLRSRIGEVGLEGIAILREHRHRFNKLGNDGTAKGNIEAAPDARVYGVAYHVNASQLELLAAVESGYRGATVIVRLGEHVLEAATFVAGIVSETVAPLPAYLDHYAAGAAEHGLPGDYLEEILPTWYRRRDD